MSSLATGPRSVEGKERASLNATKHGLRSERPIVPGEDPAEWDAFRKQTVTDLDPGSFLERELAERVALQLWRLRRAGRYEAEVAEDEFDKARVETMVRFSYLEPEDPVSQALVEQVRLIVEEQKSQEPLEAGRRLLRHLPNLVNSAALEQVEVLALMALLGITDTNELPDPLTARGLRRALAEWSGMPMIEAMTWASGVVEAKFEVMAERLAGMQKKKEMLRAHQEAHIARQERDQRLLPKGALDRVIRYEAHVSKQLNQALALLRQFKDERLAKEAAEPVVCHTSAESATREPESSSFGNSESAAPAMGFADPLLARRASQAHEASDPDPSLALLTSQAKERSFGNSHPLRGGSRKLVTPGMVGCSIS